MGIVNFLHENFKSEIKNNHPQMIQFEKSPPKTYILPTKEEVNEKVHQRLCMTGLPIQHLPKVKVSRC